MNHANKSTGRQSENFSVSTNYTTHSSALCLLFTKPPLTGQPPKSDITVSIGLLGNNSVNIIRYSYQNIFNSTLKK